jgi:hypothetical protein
LLAIYNISHTFAKRYLLFKQKINNNSYINNYAPKKIPENLPQINKYEAVSWQGTGTKSLNESERSKKKKKKKEIWSESVPE